MAAVRHMDLIITSNATAAIRGFSDLGAIAKSAESRFGKLAGTMARVGLVGAAGFATFAAGSVKAFIDFDDAMTKSLAIMDDVSGPTRKKMEDAAKAVAKTTTFSATEAAAAYKDLGSAGLSAAQSMEALPVVARFAQAAQMDMARASEYLVDTQAALGLKMRDPIENMREMTRVSDVLTKANNLATGEIEDFASALTNKAGAALKTTNKDIEEGVAVLAFMAEQGLKGSSAGEKLAIVLRDVPRAAERNAEEFKKFGISVFDSSGKLRHMADIVGEFEDALLPMSDAERAATLENLGLTRSVGDVIRQLLGGSDKIRDFEKELRNAAGTTQTVADKQVQSLKDKLKILQNQFQVLMIDFGEPIAIWLVDHFLPWLKDEFIPEMAKLAGILNDELRPAFKAMGKALKNDEFVAVLATMTAFSVGMATASKTISLIARVLAPVGTILSFLGGVLTFLLHPVVKLGEAWLWLQIKLLPVTEALGRLWKALALVGRLLLRLAGPIMAAAQAIATALGVSVAAVFAVVAAVIIAAGAIWIFRDEVGAALAAVGRFFQRLWTDSIYPHFAKPIKDFFTGPFVDVVQTAWRSGVKPVLDGMAWVLTNVILPVFNDLGIVASTAWVILSEAARYAWDNVIWPVLSGVGSFLVDTVIPALQGLGGTGGDGWTLLSEKVSSAWDNILWPVISAFAGFINNTLVPALGRVKGVAEDVWGGIATVAGIAWRIIQPILSRFHIVLYALAAGFTSMWLVGFVVWRALGIAIRLAWHNVIKPVLDAIGWAVENVVKPAFNWLSSRGVEIWNIVAGAIGWAWNNVIKPAFDLIYQAVNDSIMPVLEDLRDLAVDVWGIIGWAIDIAWRIVIKPALDGISAVINNVILPALNSLRDLAVSAWGIIQNVIGIAWNNVIRPALDGMHVILNLLVMPALRELRDLAVSAWHIIQNVVSAAWGVIKPIWDKMYEIMSAVLGVAFTVLAALAAVAWAIITGVISTAWKDFIQPIWGKMYDILSTLLTPSMAVLAYVTSVAWIIISVAVSTAWDIIGPIFDKMKWVLAGLALGMSSFWLIGFAVWQGVSAIISWAWNEGIKPTWEDIKHWLNSVLIPAFFNFLVFIGDVWENIKGVISGAWDYIKGVKNNFLIWIDEEFMPKWHAFKNGITGAMGHVRDVLSNIWESIKNTAKRGINGVIGFLNKLIGGVNDAKDLLNKIPGVNISDIPKIPTIGQETGSGKGSGSRRAGNTPSFHAAGGIPNFNPMQEGPIKTNGIRAIVGEGNPNYPEFVIPTDPRHRSAAVEFWKAAGAKLFAGGGVLPRGPGIAGLYDPLASIVQRIVNESRGAVHVVSGWRDSRKQAALYAAYKAGRGNLAAPPGSSRHERGAAVDFGGVLSVWRRLAAKYGLIFPVKGENWHAEHPGQSGRGGLLGRTMQILWESLADRYRPTYQSLKPRLPGKDIGTAWGKGVNEQLMRAFEKLDEQQRAAAMAYAPGMGGSYGGGGAERWRPVALRALSMAGAPGGWISSLLRRMQKESGGNPRAVNNWDSNAAKGQASRGLMQVIPDTFRRWAGSLFGRGIFDPLANIFASIRYTVARYGSGPAGWDKSGGYAKGAYRTRGAGLRLLHDDELIMPSAASERFRDLLETGSVGGSGVNITIAPGAVVIQLPPGASEEDIRRAERNAGKELLNTILAERRALVDARIR